MVFKDVLCALAAAALWTAAAAAAEKVDIPDGAVTLHATLYRPDGAGPFPAVVALHDCGGLDGRPAATTQLYGEWAKLLVADGFVVLFPDSFGSRGLGSQCRVRRPKVRSSRERVADANAARRWLQTQALCPPRPHFAAWLVERRLPALWTVRPNAAPHDGSPISARRSRSIPAAGGCAKPRGARASRRSSSSAAPMIGRSPRPASRWSPAPAAAAPAPRSSSIPARTTNSTAPIRPLRLRTGLAHTADPSGRAHSGTNPAARTDALKRVPQWLAR